MLADVGAYTGTITMLNDFPCIFIMIIRTDTDHDPNIALLMVLLSVIPTPLVTRGF